MPAQHSRQVRRQMARAMAKAADRAPQAKASWGDRRLNRKMRFALWALQRAIRRFEVVLVGAKEEVLAKVARDFGLPLQVVHELSNPEGLRNQLAAAA